MADPERAEFRHADVYDRVILWGNLGFSTFRYWGVAMFFLIIGVLPAGVLLYVLSSPLRLLTGRSPADWDAGWMSAVWLGLSVPIAAWCAWRHWMRLQLNRFIVDGSGIEYRWYPRPPRRIPWSRVQRVRDTWIPDVDESPTTLVFDTVEGEITLDGEDWPIDRIGAAVQQLFPVTRAAKSWQS